MPHRWTIACCLLIAALLLTFETYSEDASPDNEAQAIAKTIVQFNEQDNGVTLDTDKGHLDIQAKVCLREGDFLEMFACTRDTREHESILVLDAKPSTVHLGLLLLGLEPGKPLAYDRDADPPKLIPATGPKVKVFVVLHTAGLEREIPANRWIQDTKTQEMMEDNTWLFAGSRFAQAQDQQVYLADLNGSAISLVNFGDDLLTRPNTFTDANDSHGKVWSPRTRAIPKLGTKVILRLKPQPSSQPKEAPEDEQPQPEPASE